MTKLSIPAALAPMAGYTDYPMRKIAADFGASYVVSEMISAVAMCMNDRKTAVLAKIGEGEAPVVLQISGMIPQGWQKPHENCSPAITPAVPMPRRLPGSTSTWDARSKKS